MTVPANEKTNSDQFSKDFIRVLLAQPPEAGGLRHRHAHPRHLEEFGTGAIQKVGEVVGVVRHHPSIDAPMASR